MTQDLDLKRRLFATQGWDHRTMVNSAVDLSAHVGELGQIGYVCHDVRSAYAKGMNQVRPNAAISHNCFHAVAMAIATMDQAQHASRATNPRRSTPHWATPIARRSKA